MFRDEMSAALARAEAAERQLERLQAEKDGSQEEIEVLRAELRRLRSLAVARPDPPARPRRAPPADEEAIWRGTRRLSVVAVVLIAVYFGALVWLMAGSGDPGDAWSWLRREGLSKGPYGAYAGAVWASGILIYGLCIVVVESVTGYMERSPLVSFDTSTPVILLLVLGPIYIIPALLYAAKLGPLGRRGLWCGTVLVIVGMLTTVFFGAMWLVELNVD